MSAMLALRCAAPAFALIGGATVWAMAGPFAAGLALIIFVLGVVTSELQHLRWSRAEEAELEPAAPAVLLETPDSPELEPAAAEEEAPAAPTPVPIAPRRSFACTCEGLAIGSGRARMALAERSRRHRARSAPSPAPRRRPEPAPATPPRPAEVQTLRFRAAYEARLTA